LQYFTNKGYAMAVLSNLDLLRRVSIFESLSLSQISRLADAVGKQRIKRGDLIVEQGKKSNALFVILTGRARVVMVDSREREVILAVLGPGEYVGELSLLDGMTHSANVQAEVQTDLLVLGRTDFEACLSDNRSMALAIIQGLVGRLRKADAQISSLALMDVFARVASVLVDAAEPHGPDHLLLREKISRQDIAKRVGASREMVSRVMRDFEDQGFVQTQDDGSMLLNERRSPMR
jgi:CRP-like cAMP-binding protein